MLCKKATLLLLLIVCFTSLVKGISGVPVGGQVPERANEDAENTKIGDYRRRTVRDATISFGEAVSLVNLNVNLNGKGKKGDTCKACKTAVSLVQLLILSKKPEEDILKLAANICFEMKIMTKPLCDGLLNINGPALLHIIQNSKLTSAELCNFIVKFDCDEEPLVQHQWRVNLPQPTEDIEPQNSKENTSKPLKVLHISDTHYDPHYVEGVSDDCPLPLCCRSESGNATEAKTVSGKWGGWKCDIPERTLDSLLQHVSQKHKDIDYVIWTGDVPPHDSWSLQRDESLLILNQTVSKILETFPNIPVYPALGNHEAVPPNLFPPSSRNDKWSINYLYNKLQEDWSHWIPENSSQTIRRGAFYTVVNRPGLRIVSLNTNFCYYGNWWLILNSTDPEQELEWLVGVLKKAEEKGEKVHIIGHIPPGHTDCLKMWQTNYYDIIERFSSTIAAQFFGHTHFDEFELFYEKNNSENAVNVAYLAPSVTTFTYLNPSYRIYYIDGDHEGTTRAVLDHDTWFMDLEEANAAGIPTWQKLYSAKDAYNMTALTPKDWHKVYTKIKTDDDLFQLYERFFWTSSPKRSPCDLECKKDRLCGIKSCTQYGSLDLSA